MPSTPHIDHLIAALADGTITRAELHTLKEWTDSSAEHRRHVRQQIQWLVAGRTHAEQTPFDTDRAISRFRQHLDRQASAPATCDSPASAPPTVVLTPRRLRWVAVAAVALLALLPWMAFRAGSNAVKHHFADIILEAPEGSQLSLRLPDGTAVRLNSGSKLTYSQGFGITDRRVEMEGEAYFRVKHNEQLPFCVNTRELTLNDLGTEFNFRNFSDDTKASVELYDGKVNIDNRVSHVSGYELRPGERVVIDKQTGKMVKTAVTATIGEARELSKLHFENMTIERIAKELGRSYGVDIKVAGSVANLRFYGTFDRKTETLDEILTTLASTGSISYRHKGNRYAIY